MGYYWTFLLLPAFFGSSYGNCGAPPRLDYGSLNTLYSDLDNFTLGATVDYSCQSGYITVSGKSNVITCLSDSSWSTPDEFCTRRSCGHPGDIEHGETLISDILFGSRVNYTCNLGYVMISKRNYRDCQADGTWSNEVPVCEVQSCPPPPPITDGHYEPDLEDYVYQHSVTYTCKDSTLSLIGDKSIYCTSYGNWSAEPPKCIVVDCKSPDVENAKKLSGFVGPYSLNSAVRFECESGYKMNGSPSVKCNASSEWDPPLPTCSKTVTPTPTTTKGKEAETGGSTVALKTTKQQSTEGNGGENNSGAIVGGVIGGIIGILIAASIIYACWFRRKKGDDYIAPTRKNPDSGPSSSPQPPIEQYDMKQLEAQTLGSKNSSLVLKTLIKADRFSSTGVICVLHHWLIIISSSE
ncbi:membrane cofactor protein-like isoform X2 [Dendrobates tinctorius]|uniref:membrane cofactor protein-like isoform X2 n=1 Tax=Dendrobates tinctorius TaxID=92724 RepID=UPI003CCA4C9E